VKKYNLLHLSTLIARIVSCAIAVSFVAAVGGWAAEPPPLPGAILEKEKKAGPFEMRGFGRVSSDGRLWKTGIGQVSLVRLVCENADHARVLASKYREDLLAYGAAKLTDTPSGIGGTAIEVRFGGIWLIGVEGEVVSVVRAPDAKSLATSAAAFGGAKWEEAPERIYPRYLDNFDNASLGIWWEPGTKTDDQLAWMKDFPAVANLHRQGLNPPAAGVYETSGAANAMFQLREIGKPYRYMLFSTARDKNWLNIVHLPGEHVLQRPAGDTSGTYFLAGGYYQEQLASPLVNTVLTDSLVQIMSRNVNDPNLLAWMEPHGEFNIETSEQPSVPPGHADRFPAYLRQVKEYTLPTISETYTGNRNSYSSWEQVPYPDAGYFAGRRGSFVDLDDKPWSWGAGSLDDGIKNRWSKMSFDDAGWPADLRESKLMLSQRSNDTDDRHPLWYRFTHDVPEAFLKSLAGGKVFLNIMPYTAKDGRELDVWVNDVQLGHNAIGEQNDWVNRHTQLDVTSALKPGENRFIIFSKGGNIQYRVFLSGIKKEQFPFSDVRLSHQYLDWKDYLIWERLQVLESYLKVMRSADPNRPIKVMTPHLFQSDAFDLFEKYGAYPQLTGESSWYRPMHYKGYAALRDLPGSSEPGGPVSSAREMQQMAANMFWESQDCHDYVFDLSYYLWPRKEVLQWWNDNKTLLRTLGKTDFARPFQLGELRDVQQGERYGRGDIYNWDMARGPLPSLGLTPVLIDGRDMEKGLANKIPVIVDCATIVMEPALVDAIENYVRQGGIFIAQHHTGQSTDLKPDLWPLATRFGLKIQPATGEKKIQFTDDQTLLPQLRGKEFLGSGAAIDYQNKEHGGAITIAGEGPNIRPVAWWKGDHTMAIAEVTLGRGKLIVLGTPFYLRFRDSSGVWLNEPQRQDLIAQMLESLGIKKETSASDRRIWFERRESKNGLYDVYFASPMGMGKNDWKLTDVIESDLTISRPESGKVVEPTKEGCPEVRASFADGNLDLGVQQFSPYQIRQFAILRKDVGLEGPLHWLEAQRRFWRALEPVPASLADSIHRKAQEIADDFGEKGMDIGTGWRVRLDPADTKDESWAAADISGMEAWKEGNMGTWISNGWKDATCAQYRKRIELPESWRKDGSRILIGLCGAKFTAGQQGIQDKGVLWVNGRKISEDLRGDFLFDVTREAFSGVLDIAMQVEAKGLERGPGGTLYLRSLPKPRETTNLAEGWTKIEDWEGKDGGTVSFPLDGRKIFALKRNIKVPKEYAGHPMRLVIEHPVINHNAMFSAAIVNRTGYLSTVDWYPVGARIDRWLKPGEENEVILLGGMYQARNFNGFQARANAIRLEILPIQGDGAKRK
jgi:hypothetical protein